MGHVDRDLAEPSSLMNRGGCSPASGNDACQDVRIAPGVGRLIVVCEHNYGVAGVARRLHRQFPRPCHVGGPRGTRAHAFVEERCRHPNLKAPAALDRVGLVPKASIIGRENTGSRSHGGSRRRAGHRHGGCHPDTVVTVTVGGPDRSLSARPSGNGSCRPAARHGWEIDQASQLETLTCLMASRRGSMGS